jgi:hypothetical protein
MLRQRQSRDNIEAMRKKRWLWLALRRAETGANQAFKYTGVKAARLAAAVALRQKPTCDAQNGANTH